MKEKILIRLIHHLGNDIYTGFILGSTNLEDKNIQEGINETLFTIQFTNQQPEFNTNGCVFLVNLINWSDTIEVENIAPFNLIN